MTEVPSRRRRGLGAAALVLALSPAAIAVVVFIATIVSGVMQSGEAAFGWLVVGLVATGLACFVLGGLAIILGIVAIVTNRGRGFGIAGLAISAIGILVALPFFLTFSL